MAQIIPSGEKVFMVSKGTNTTYSGSASLKAMNDWYTMEDVSNTVRPYKVYTALVSQSGGDVLEQLDSSTIIQNVTKGITYRIDSIDVGADFTNVGAPNNDLGTSFVAINNEVPKSWGENNTAVLLFNTGAPTVTVLENTIGNIWWTYNGVGIYLMNSTDLFTNNKTALFNKSIPDEPINANFVSSYDSPDGIVYVGFLDGEYSNNILISTTIEIRVYN